MAKAGSTLSTHLRMWRLEGGLLLIILLLGLAHCVGVLEAVSDHGKTVRRPLALPNSSDLHDPAQVCGLYGNLMALHAQLFSRRHKKMIN